MYLAVGHSILRSSTANVVHACVLATLLAACGSDSEPATAQGLPLLDQNNYTSQSSLAVPSIETESGADLDICWSDLTKDILCHDLDVTKDINNVTFLQTLNLTQDEIQAKLALGQLTQKEVKIYRDFHIPTDHPPTCTKLSSLSLGTTLLDPTQDYVEASDKKYMLLFSTGTMLGVGSRSMLFIEPKASSTLTSVDAPSAADTCKILDFTADISSETVKVPVNGAIRVDWSRLTRDSTGSPVVFQFIDRLLVAFYENKTVEDLEQHFKDIEIDATSLYEVPIQAGTKAADLSTAKDRATGEAFPGFGTKTGVWALGLLCSSCQVPAPVFLSVLEPSAP